MITAYALEQTKLKIYELKEHDHIPEHTFWLDVFRPDEAERAWLSSFFMEEMPEEEDLKELEASARFYYDRDGLHVNSLFPQRIGLEVKAINVAFTLRAQLMLTIREDDLGLIRLVRNYLRTQRIVVDTPYTLFLALFVLKIEYISDIIEDVYTVLEDVGKNVFEAPDLDQIFKQITYQEDVNGKVRLSLLDTQRSLRYISRYHRQHLNDDNIKELKEILSDIDSLMPHSQFIFDKLNFLLESTIGFSGLQQNKIIKIFSVAAVVFLPPTLIASSYGMNFAHMPELDWTFGYPIAIGLMVASAVGTYFFFRRKGWL
jgi:magnesium transporter